MIEDATVTSVGTTGNLIFTLAIFIGLSHRDKMRSNDSRRVIVYLCSRHSENGIHSDSSELICKFLCINT